jgi:hypothetical protein
VHCYLACHFRLVVVAIKQGLGIGCAPWKFREELNCLTGVEGSHRLEDARTLAALAWLAQLAKVQGDSLPNDGTEFLGTGQSKKVRRYKKMKRNFLEEEDSDAVVPPCNPKVIATRVQAPSRSECVTCRFASLGLEEARPVVPMHMLCGLCGCAACPSEEANVAHDNASATKVLPYYTKLDVYHQYCCDFVRSNQVPGALPIDLSTFKRLWSDELGHIKVSRSKSGWARCTECEHFRLLVSKAGSAADRQKYLDCYHSHLEFQRRQRLKYYKHRQKGIDDPDSCLSIIMDAMDQAKCEIPHPVRDTKATTDAEKMKQKVMGCMAHGYGMYLYL